MACGSEAGTTVEVFHNKKGGTRFQIPPFSIHVSIFSSGTHRL